MNRRVAYERRIEFLAELLNKVNPNGELIGAEIGVWRGHIVIGLLETVSRISRMYAIDAYRRDPARQSTTGLTQEEYDALCEEAALAYKTSGVEDRVTKIRKWSEEAIDDVPFLDFIHIDGEHTYDQVRKDISNYFTKIKPGGLMCGHDYKDPEDTSRRVKLYPGVKKAVDRFAKENRLELHSFGDPVFTWWWYLPEGVKNGA